VPIQAGRLTESWGVGERFALVDVGSRTYWFATANAPEGEPDDPAARKAELIARFSRWHPPIGSVLDATPDSVIVRNDVYFLEPLPRWGHRRIVLLGRCPRDHPRRRAGRRPSARRRVVLADEIADSDDLSAGLARYESIRRPRAALALKLSRRVDAAAQLANPIGCRVRNALARRTRNASNADNWRR
jgi:2-polyprenyl-6-methoxyphenol hydroxylase-like FAD-dependent oxidoreductase